MKVDPFAPQLLIDYTYFCDRFGPLPFGDFVAMWHAADALAAPDVGYEPDEVPNLLITADNPRIAFIRATVARIRPNIARMLPWRRRCAAMADDRARSARQALITVDRYLGRAAYVVTLSRSVHERTGEFRGIEAFEDRRGEYLRLTFCDRYR